MFRFATPIIFLGLAIAGFFTFTSPLYNGTNGITDLRAQVAARNEALDNSKALENEKEKLTAKENSIAPDDLDKLEKLLPDNVDNIRLILEIEKIASPYGMELQDVKYSTTSTTPATTGALQGGAVPVSNKDYGTWDLEFSTQATYTNFLNFTKDLQSNLRLVDISSIQFSSDTGTGQGVSSDSYKYSFKIKTYWLKN
jgi:hypothetical protein